CAIDLNNDGYLDIAVAAISSNQIAWWENDGSAHFTEHTITDNFNGATWIHIDDVDKDGDKDIVGGAQGDNEISWWENSLYKSYFEVIPNSGHAPLTAQFTDHSTFSQPITSRSWDFNNDGIIDSFEENPEWTYEDTGIYSVKLEIQIDTLLFTTLYEEYISVFNGESALEFSSENSNVMIEASDNLNLTQEFSVEAWIKPVGWGINPNNGYGRIIDKEYISLYLVKEHSLYNDSSLLLILKHDDGSFSQSNTPENSIVLDEWQHIAATYNQENETTIYINGSEQILLYNTLPNGPVMDNIENELYIGNNSNLDKTFEGTIDEIRIWNIGRTSEEINLHYNNFLYGNENGLVGYWQMNEGYGQLLEDLSGNSNSGTIYHTNWIQGKELDLPILSKELRHEEFNNFIIYIYPNPASNYVNLGINPVANQKITINIQNITGRVVLAKSLFVNESNNQNDYELNLTDLMDGFYILKITYGHFSESHKLVINHK
ncbi:LamG-like jellyroll fold domain-containing protein, partial [Bacteroidota bacterium]